MTLADLKEFIKDLELAAVPDSTPILSFDEDCSALYEMDNPSLANVRPFHGTGTFHIVRPGDDKIGDVQAIIMQ